MNNNFNDLLHKEVFVLGPDEDVALSTETLMFETFEALAEHMKTMPVSMDDDLRILHGYLTSAKTLPSIMRGKKAYIIIEDSDNQGETKIVEVEPSARIEGLSQEITEIIKDDFNMTDIDHVYVLYGYVINIILAPDDEDLDDEVKETCEEISKEVEQIVARNKRYLREQEIEEGLREGAV